MPESLPRHFDLPEDMTGESLFFGPAAKCESCGATREWVHADDFDRLRAERDRYKVTLEALAQDGHVEPIAAERARIALSDGEGRSR